MTLLVHGIAVILAVVCANRWLDRWAATDRSYGYRGRWFG